jgi:hypothetical protein
VGHEQTPVPRKRRHASRITSPAERLADDRKFVLRPVAGQHICRIPGSEQNFDSVAQPLRFAGKFNARNSLRHHDVAEQEIKPFAGLQQLDRLAAIASANHLIAKVAQHRRCDV